MTPNSRETREQQDRSGMTGRSGFPRLPHAYLNSGYFDERGNIFPNLVTATAEEVAKGLGVGGVTSNQLRRFYNKAKAVEQRVSSGESFESAVAGVLELKQHAANAVGRAQGRSEQEGIKLLKSFIDCNVDLAVRSMEAFHKGFLLHFQGVVAYFKYHYPKK